MAVVWPWYGRWVKLERAADNDPLTRLRDAEVAKLGEELLRGHQLCEKTIRCMPSPRPDGLPVYRIPSWAEFLFAPRFCGYESFMFAPDTVVSGGSRFEFGVVRGHRRSGYTWLVDVETADGVNSYYAEDLAAVSMPPSLLAIAARHAGPSCEKVKQKIDEVLA